VEIVSVYKCLCDVTRLRILNLLSRGPLCVCYLQEILGEPQVKISKHLSYLKQHGLIECERRANWSIYRLPKKTNRLLSENLKCLQDLAGDEKPFKIDLRRLDKLDTSPACGVTK
jgi:ArsR family transcriptional regulator, arsenate/arsenite/antimonite-responsive transcriptional repressor